MAPLDPGGEGMGGPATELMLELARVGPGDRVLDIAAGDDDQSLLAAAHVGPTGFVLATDIAPNLVSLAAQTARESGVKNLEARIMDAENLTVDDEAFDVVISRFGLSFLLTCREDCRKSGVC